jgi:hypothetical protein
MAKQLEDKQGARLQQIHKRLNTKKPAERKFPLQQSSSESELMACIDPPKPLTAPTKSNMTKQQSHHSSQSTCTPQ